MTSGGGARPAKILSGLWLLFLEFDDHNPERILKTGQSVRRRRLAPIGAIQECMDALKKPAHVVNAWLKVSSMDEDGKVEGDVGEAVGQRRGSGHLLARGAQELHGLGCDVVGAQKRCVVEDSSAAAQRFNVDDTADTVPVEQDVAGAEIAVDEVAGRQGDGALCGEKPFARANEATPCQSGSGQFATQLFTLAGHAGGHILRPASLRVGVQPGVSLKDVDQQPGYAYGHPGRAATGNEVLDLISEAGGGGAGGEPCGGRIAGGSDLCQSLGGAQDAGSPGAVWAPLQHCVSTGVVGQVPGS